MALRRFEVRGTRTEVQTEYLDPLASILVFAESLIVQEDEENDDSNAFENK
jgi:hypothetical protein